jgi:endonuclease/exonuclease/phosphatase family metal-dependent hydrolase
VKSLAVVLTILTYNVHGLDAWLVDDDPEARLPQISERLDKYDVVFVQEIWSYFDLLSVRATHPVRERGNGPDPGALFQTGLATFARPPLVAVSRGSLGACSGWLSGANDCFADKGYLRVRLRLENGVALDFWNLHLDAGDGEADRAARATQLEHLVERVRALSGHGALVIAGDFNLPAETPEDHMLVERFVQALELVDSGARSAPDGRFADKHIDYILYRDGPGVSLEPLEVGEAREFSDGAAPLSDHPALFMKLQVTPVAGVGPPSGP